LSTGNSSSAKAPDSGPSFGRVQPGQDIRYSGDTVPVVRRSARIRVMGVRGPGLWSDDTACDVRGTYREALEDGLADGEARAKVESAFAFALADEDSATVVWLALAAVQSHLGRLDPDVGDRAVEIIDNGSNLRQWEEAPALLEKRRAALAKLRGGLLGPQLDRKRVRKPPQRNTALAPGDVVAYLAHSGRTYLLAVHALRTSRYGTYPIVRLLEFEGTEVPDPDGLEALRARPPWRPHTAGMQWWAVQGQVQHKRGHDFADCGFRVVGHVSAPRLDEQERLAARPGEYQSWRFWSGYLDKQDEMLSQRTAR